MFYGNTIADLLRGSTKYTNETLRSALRTYRPDRDTPIGMWDVSEVTDMSELFAEIPTFNEDISNWDVSNVITMRGMFRGAALFNQPLNNWDVGHVIDFSNMFEGAASFNQSLNNWNLRSVVSISFMFAETLAFNQPLDRWTTSHINSYNGCFDQSCYRQPIRWTLPSKRQLPLFTHDSLLEIIVNWIIELHEPSIPLRHQLAQTEMAVRYSMRPGIQARIRDRTLLNQKSPHYEQIHLKIEAFLTKLSKPPIEQLLAELDNPITVEQQIEIFNTALHQFEAPENRSRLRYAHKMLASAATPYASQLHDSYHQAKRGTPIHNDPINPLMHALHVVPIDEYLLPREIAMNEVRKRKEDEEAVRKQAKDNETTSVHGRGATRRRRQERRRRRASTLRAPRLHHR